jgi:two-component system OmpR family sensor kinase
MSWPGSLRVRLTLWYSALLALPLVSFAIASYLVVARTLESRTDRFLSDALTTFSRELVAERRSANSLGQAVQKTLDEVHFRDLHIAILDDRGTVLASTTLPGDGEGSPGASWRAIRDSLGALRAGYGGDEALHTVRGGVEPFRLLALPLELDGRALRVVGAYAMGDLGGVLRGLRRLFLIAIPLLIAAAAAGGYSLARRSLAPVSAMARRAAEITATNLDERLPVGGTRELAGLARVINELLDRLERAFAQQRRFVADASHELRTPTAIVRSESEVTLSQPHREETEYRGSMTVIGDAARRLSRVVDDLFLLARADAGQQVMRREPLYLEEVAQDAARAMKTVADRKQVQIALQGIAELPVEGDADLLGRLLLNLLDNAVRHSPPGQVVQLRLGRDNATCEVRVADQGPGIPAEARARVFEPFFRSDNSRSRDGGSGGGGAGLGLAIARRIAEMHAGRLDLTTSRPGRTEFTLRLPVTQ